VTRADRRATLGTALALAGGLLLLLDLRDLLCRSEHQHHWDVRP
jgi:hypothetical protein